MTRLKDGLRRSLSALGASLRPPALPEFAALAAMAAVLLIFVFSTGLIWEDYLITYKYSENLAHGQGMVYNPGERVYGFTSPLNMLLPALFCAVSGRAGFFVSLWLFRLVSLTGMLAAGVAILSAFRAQAPQSGIRRAAAVMLVLAFALEIKTAAFSMSGQEAGLVIGFLGPALAALAFGIGEHWLCGGLAWAGLMYSRPDAFIAIGALGLAGLIFPAGPRRQTLLGVAKAAAVCAALYLPWFLFTWAYYGSPVPHTVTAKIGLSEANLDGFGLAELPALLLSQAPVALCAAFAPIYDKLTTGIGAWPAWIHDLSFFLELGAVAYWVIPTRDRLGRIASFVALILLCYLEYVTLKAQYNPWYYPPLAFVSLVALASAFAALAQALPWRGLGRLALGASFAALLGLLGFIFAASLAPLRFKQEAIEWNHRRAVGLWLREHVRPGESVYLEPLGYIGYFSGAHMLDWPGLVSAQVLQARRRIGPMTDDNWARVAAELRPEWIVSRPNGIEMMKRIPALAQHYRPARLFDASARFRALGSAAGAPGMYVNYPDAVFAVYRRVD